MSEKAASIYPSFSSDKVPYAPTCVPGTPSRLPVESLSDVSTGASPGSVAFSVTGASLSSRMYSSSMADMRSPSSRGTQFSSRAPSARTLPVPPLPNLSGVIPERGCSSDRDGGASAQSGRTPTRASSTCEKDLCRGRMVEEPPPKPERFPRNFRTDLEAWIAWEHFPMLPSLQAYMEFDHRPADPGQLAVVTTDCQTSSPAVEKLPGSGHKWQVAMLAFRFRFPAECARDFIRRAAPASAKVLAISAVEALEATTADYCRDLRFGLRWPHDIVVRDSKIGRVMSRPMPDRDWLDGVLLMLEINLNTWQSDHARRCDAVGNPPTSLQVLLDKEFNVAAFRNLVVTTFANKLSDLFVEGFRAFRSRVNSLEVLRGTNVVFRLREGIKIDGNFKGFDDDGDIILKLASGEEKSFRPPHFLHGNMSPINHADMRDGLDRSVHVRSRECSVERHTLPGTSLSAGMADGARHRSVSKRRESSATRNQMNFTFNPSCGGNDTGQNYVGSGNVLRSRTQDTECSPSLSFGRQRRQLPQLPQQGWCQAVDTFHMEHERDQFEEARRSQWMQYETGIEKARGFHADVDALRACHEQDRKNLEAELERVRVDLLAKTQIEAELKGVSACQDAERKRLESELEHVKTHLAAKSAIEAELESTRASWKDDRSRLEGHIAAQNQVAAELQAETDRLQLEVELRESQQHPTKRRIESELEFMRGVPHNERVGLEPYLGNNPESQAIKTLIQAEVSSILTSHNAERTRLEEELAYARELLVARESRTNEIQKSQELMAPVVETTYATPLYGAPNLMAAPIVMQAQVETLRATVEAQAPREKELQTLLASHKEETTRKEAEREAELTSLHATHQDERARLEAELERTRSHLSEKHRAEEELQALHASQEAERKRLELELQKTRGHLESKHQVEAELQSLSARHDVERQNLEIELGDVRLKLAAKAHIEAELEKSRLSWEKEKKDFQVALEHVRGHAERKRHVETEFEKLRQTHEDEKIRLGAELEDVRAQALAKAHLENELQVLRASHSEEITRAEAELQRYRSEAELKRQIEAELMSLQTTHHDERARLEAELDHMRNHFSEKLKVEEELQAVHASHEAQRRRLELELETTRSHLETKHQAEAELENSRISWEREKKALEDALEEARGHAKNKQEVEAECERLRKAHEDEKVRMMSFQDLRLEDERIRVEAEREKIKRHVADKQRIEEQRRHLEVELMQTKRAVAIEHDTKRRLLEDELNQARGKLATKADLEDELEHARVTWDKERKDLEAELERVRGHEEMKKQVELELKKTRRAYESDKGRLEAELEEVRGAAKQVELERERSCSSYQQELDKTRDYHQQELDRTRLEINRLENEIEHVRGRVMEECNAEAVRSLNSESAERARLEAELEQMKSSLLEKEKSELEKVRVEGEASAMRNRADLAEKKHLEAEVQVAELKTQMRYEQEKRLPPPPVATTEACAVDLQALDADNQRSAASNNIEMFDSPQVSSSISQSPQSEPLPNLLPSASVRRRSVGKRQVSKLPSDLEGWVTPRSSQDKIARRSSDGAVSYGTSSDTSDRFLLRRASSGLSNASQMTAASPRRSSLLNIFEQAAEKQRTSTPG